MNDDKPVAKMRVPPTPGRTLAGLGSFDDYKASLTVDSVCPGEISPVTDSSSYSFHSVHPKSHDSKTPACGPLPVPLICQGQRLELAMTTKMCRPTMTGRARENHGM
jgi:hypothetical protein